MKKLFSMIFVIIYLLFISGISLAEYFCQGEIQSVKLYFYSNHDDNCSCLEDFCCGECDFSCCHVEIVTFKILDSQDFTKNYKDKIFQRSTIVSLDGFYQTNGNINILKENYLLKSLKVPRYIFNSSFLV